MSLDARSQCELCFQIARLTTALKRMFQRERDSANATSDERPLNVPEVLSGATLGAPDTEYSSQPLTPTSPADGRLRSILKKAPPSPSASDTTAASVTTNSQTSDNNSTLRKESTETEATARQSSDSESSSPKTSSSH